MLKVWWMLAGATFLAAGCSAQSETDTGATRGPGETVAPTTVVTTGTTTTVAGTRPTVPATTAGVPPAGSAPVLPAGVYLGRFSAVDTARKGATFTIMDADPECSATKSGTYFVDLTKMNFVASGSNGMGEAVDLTFGDWAKDYANQGAWTVINLPGHELVTSGVNAGCHP